MMGDLLPVGLLIVYVFVGVITLSAFWRENDDFDGVCLLMIITWPIVAIAIIVFMIFKLAWDIGKLLRKLFR